MSYRVWSLALLLILSILLTLPLPPLAVISPSPPQLIAPITGIKTTTINYPPTGTPDFAWSPVSGTELYRIQVSNDPDFSGTPPVNQVTPYTSYTPVIYLPDGLWYWRVRVESPVKSLYGIPWQFTKQWAAPENHPILLEPADQADLDFFTSPAFSWQPVIGATAYRYQVASDNLFTTASLKVNIVTSSSAYQPLSKLANGTYKWRVIPIDVGGNAGASSQVRSIRMSYGSDSFLDEIPTLLEPLDQSSISPEDYQGSLFSPTFRWTAVRGASSYLLQFTTGDPTCNFDSTQTTNITTQNTSYTPDTMPENDQGYCWRVRAISGQSQPGWSEVWKFTRRWHIQPELLTPPQHAQNVSTPYFSWTPVPGASQYKLEVDLTGSFTNPLFESTTSHNYAYKLDDAPFLPSPGKKFYWRVTPLDSGGDQGTPSEVFEFTGGNAAPQLISPPYYYAYPPSGYPAGSELDPHQDPTAAYPVFTWHRWITGTAQSGAYRIEVNSDPAFPSPSAWITETEGTSAAPTWENPFQPQPGVSYYWRVCRLTEIGGTMLGSWSDAWRARFNPALASSPSPAINLLRPRQAAEIVESIPILEWQPLQGAVKYEVQISPDPGFDQLSDSGMTQFPVYTPSRHLDLYPESSEIGLEYGSYYWRVQGYAGNGNLIGGWSQPGRFQVAAQDHWRENRALVDLPKDESLIAADEQTEVSEKYDIKVLYAAGDSHSGLEAWHFGFNIPGTSNSVTYVLYIDTDQVDNSGANVDAEGYDLATTPGHRPEYALYVFPNGGNLLAEETHFYHWQNGAWVSPSQTLIEIGGSLYYSPTINYAELSMPAFSIGMDSKARSLSLALAAIDNTTGDLEDSVPPSGSSGTLTRFTAISDRLTVAAPVQDSVQSEMPSFSWHLPLDVPWYGYQIQIDNEPGMVFPLVDQVISGSESIYPDFGLNDEIGGDGTYYWRVRPVYNNAGFITGSWSQPSSFELKMFAPVNIQGTVSFASPAFRWSRVEGADSYEIEVDASLNFQTPEFDPVTTRQNTFSPPVNLAPGMYYWHVRMDRSSSIHSDWSTPKSFTVTLPVPAGLIPDNLISDGPLPALCWTQLVANSNGKPVFTAYRYEVQVGKGFDFSTIYSSVETEQPCWTPGSSMDGKKAITYPDGTYHWHVAMIDGNNNHSLFSQDVQFSKRSPVPTLTYPVGGSAIPVPLTFYWETVPGAARYILEVSQDPSFSTFLEAIATPNTRYTPVILYPTTGAIYWRVATVDLDGNTGPYARASVNGGKTFIPMIWR